MQGIGRREHLGAQICVLRDGIPVADLALGEASPDRRMRTDSIVPWLSGGKPVTALGILALADRGDLALDSRVVEFLPEFGAGGKEGITIRHLLVHAGGFRPADRLDPFLSHPEALKAICATPLESGWIPGETAGYHRFASWQVLGEILRIVSGRPLAAFLQERILGPLGIEDSRLVGSAEERVRLDDRLSVQWVTVGGELRPDPVLQAPESFSLERPGSGFRGPARDLARFYARLLSPPPGWLDPATLRDATSRQRVGRFDRTFQAVVDMGLGFVLNTVSPGDRPMPYGYGIHASPGTFGHSGSQSGCGFADPLHRLAVSWWCNGMPGEGVHQRRQREVNTAIYEDLGLAPASPHGA